MLLEERLMSDGFIDEQVDDRLIRIKYEWIMMWHVGDQKFAVQFYLWINLHALFLPGITRVPVHGQPQNIYEQIAAMIRHYVTPPETVILNVLSATVDFCTCESIRISNEIDKLGERTLAVVTKVDRAPEGVFEKVSANDVGIGLGYICVRLIEFNTLFHEPFLSRRCF